MIFLQVETGPAAGLIFELKENSTLIIGRGEDAGLRILDERISRKHVSITTKKNSFIIKDLGSRNGTFYKNKKIKTAEIFAGESFRAGNSVFFLNETDVDTSDTIASDTLSLQVEREINSAELSEIARAIFHSESANLLFRLQSALQLATTIDEFVEFAFLFIKRHFSFETAALLIGESGGKPQITKVFPALRQQFELAKNLWQRSFQQGEALLLSAGSKESELNKGFSAAICAPLRKGEEILGVFYLEKKKGAFKKADFDFALQCAEIIAIPLARLLELADLRKAPANKTLNVEIIGQDETFLPILELLEKVAPTDVPVLLTGETGTGKELIARAIYEMSKVPGEFIALNCAAIPKDLLEAELFGYEEGAFTGAAKTRKGKIELAHNGVLFLDEISEMPLELQAVMLRVLQEHIFYPIGAEKPVRSNFRLVSATNRDLNQRVKENKFRQDLLFRIRVFTLELPPLRERKSDIKELADYFCGKIGSRLGKKIRGCTDEVLEAFKKYDWYGNVRELENVIERAIVLADSEFIEMKHLPREIAEASTNNKSRSSSFFEYDTEVITLEEAERRAIIRALKATGGKKGETAKLLGCSWPTLNKKIKELKIEITEITDA